MKTYKTYNPPGSTQTTKEVKKFEREWNRKFKTKNSIAVNSCTAALHLAMRAINLKRNA